ncbi:hypothetical protein C8J57DRAFT_1229465 [Mycena rebaudengoi]|nr:hypothetical protein C8J57DRAFT_1229465 [Mycena rebaudengoi]
MGMPRGQRKAERAQHIVLDAHRVDHAVRILERKHICSTEYTDPASGGIVRTRLGGGAEVRLKFGSGVPGVRRDGTPNRGRHIESAVDGGRARVVQVLDVYGKWT